MATASATPTPSPGAAPTALTLTNIMYQKKGASRM